MSKKSRHGGASMPQGNEPQPPVDSKLTFEDLRVGYRDRKSFEVVAVDGYEGRYVGNGVRVGREPTIYPIAQLFELPQSYARSILDDPWVQTRIVE